MSRKIKREEKTVTRLEVTEELTCDKCGNPISHDAWDNPEACSNELLVYLNPDECVNFRFRRDYCSVCLEPIWNALCTLIGANPEDCSGSDFEDE